MADMDFIEVFQEETTELLEELENSLLELEDSPDDMKLVGKVFRSMHTIKGSSAMFGFDEIADFTHHVETTLDKVREGVVPVTKELINLTLESRDFIKLLMEEASGGDKPDRQQGQTLIDSLKTIASGEARPAETSSAESSSPPEEKEAVDAEPEEPPEVSEFSEVFQEETTELLEELENSLLELEDSPGDMKLVGKVFRSMHTIKGSSSMFGFDEIADFTHHVETVLDKVRDGAVPVTKELINLTLESRDFIKLLMEEVSGGDRPDRQRGQTIIDNLQAIASGEAPAEEEEAAQARPQEKQSDQPDKYFQIEFKPLATFFEGGGDVEQLLDALKEIGTCTIQVEGCRDAESLSLPAWQISITTDQDINGVKDVFIFAESGADLSVVAADKPDTAQPEPAVPEKLQAQKQPASPPPSKKQPRQEKKKKVEPGKSKSVESLRVAADKLDQLVNLVGELVVTQARLTDVATVSQQAELFEPVEQVEYLTAELRDLVLNIRMLPIGTTFTRFKRLVRDLSSELGKKVRMVTSGEETELDKTVIEQLNDPLIHLIRNSMDHGIQSPEERQAQGLPPEGTLTLSAAHTGANVVITVGDDGNGLDPEILRAKSIEKGIITADEELSEQEIFNLIFSAGFSTAQKVSSVSGRGVGMDVVKSGIERLRGTVQLSSAKGKGTVVTITLPLTLAIIDGLLVRSGDTHFVLPLSEVEECVELTREDIDRFHDRNVFAVRDHLIPYVRLRDFFDLSGKRPEREQLVIVHHHNEQFGLAVEEVIGGHQTVIKSLGWVYRNVQGLSGSTILGNGEVALIIDTGALVTFARQEERASLE